ncbi:hypothetical protein B0H16DRAFT_1297330 [Mycena metata]|uniref:Uncharacterized protein n=1 Tax=Mycena metata TaxID=1033252 RepID=A0AAD7KE58_9AGAR|nr:hypothetical protein B0H16DRAFT_1297330 [Mycena metata]
MATIKTTTPALPDYITYRFANRLVYVRPAHTYEVRVHSFTANEIYRPRLIIRRPALDIAQKEFIELATIPRERISFNTVASLNRQEPRVVRISESAWFAAVARQLCGGVIDILVSPDPSAPPTYLAVPSPGEMTKDEVEILRKTRSTPSSPTHSRQSSPSGRSTKSAKRSWLPRLN